MRLTTASVTAETVPNFWREMATTMVGVRRAEVPDDVGDDQNLQEEDAIEGIRAADPEAEEMEAGDEDRQAGGEQDDSGVPGAPEQELAHVGGAGAGVEGGGDGKQRAEEGADDQEDHVGGGVGDGVKGDLAEAEVADDSQIQATDEEHAGGPDGEGDAVGEHLARHGPVRGEEADADVRGEGLPADNLHR